MKCCKVLEVLVICECCGSVINMYEVLKNCGSVIVVCGCNENEMDVYEDKLMEGEYG